MHALASIPPPPFQDVSIGSLTLHGYGLVMGIAIVAAITIAEWGLKRQGVDTSRFTPFALWCVLAGFVGARLYHVASEPVRYWNSPDDIMMVWEGGLGIYGAIFGGVIVGLLIAPRFGIPRGAISDAVVPAFLVAQAIGRTGNYLNQELFGRPFDGPWALEVDPQYRPDGFEDVATWHPTFLYEQLGTLAFALVFVALLVRWTSRPRGILLPLYVAAYSLVRLLVEPLRVDSAHEWLGVRQNVWVAGTLLVGGLVVAAVMWRRDPARRP
jgi:prolipoprotein diacylglyceryl transferase